MPRLAEGQLRSYRKHKQSGQAMVALGGRDYLLGNYGSEESRARYRRLTGEWQSRVVPKSPRRNQT